MATKTEEFLERADVCEARAKDVQTAEAKLRFQHLAQLWRCMAEQTELRGKLFHASTATITP